MESEIIEEKISEGKNAYSVTFIDGSSRVVLYTDSKKDAEEIQKALARNVRDASIF